MILETYSPAGDMLTVMLCILCWMLLFSTYASKQRNLTIFSISTVIMAVISTENVIYHSIMATATTMTGVTGWILFLLEATRYILMLAILVCFVVYLTNLFSLPDQTKKTVTSLAIPPFVLYSISKLGKPFSDLYNYKEWSYSLGPQWGFLMCYLAYCIYLMVIIQLNRRKIAPKMVACLQQSFILSLTLTIGQSLVPTTTFLSVSFMFPILTALFLFHYNSYDMHTGGLSRTALPKYLDDNDGKELGIYALHLKNFIFDKNPIALVFLQSAEQIFTNYQIFRISDDTLFLVFNKKNNINIKALHNVVTGRVDILYENFHIPYKLVYMECKKDLIDSYGYITMFESVKDKMRWNAFYKSGEEDFVCMNKHSYLHKLFREIDGARVTSHPNIKVYYQPIWDVDKKTYSSVEVLSRIVYNDELIYPDEYIPFAAQNGYIGHYNKIVFNQACEQFAELMKTGVELNGISMNFSVQEILSQNFVREIVGILRKHNIPKDKVAIEITESADAECTDRIIHTILQLKSYGMQVYLDDFGVEYSNLNRVVSWPVDVIKIDKNLTWSMRNAKHLESVIGDIISSLKKAGYKILFEGIETEDDFNRCKALKASYLQGFKYSQPIDYPHLLQFFDVTM